MHYTVCCFFEKKDKPAKDRALDTTRYTLSQIGTQVYHKIKRKMR